MIALSVGIFLTFVCLIAFSIVPVLNENIQLFSFINANLATFQAIGSIAIAASAMVAFSIYKLSIKRHEQEDAYKASRTFLDESIIIIERAFEIFSDKSEGKRPLRNSRVLWLTVARMIVRFYDLRGKITVKEHIEIADQHEEYWRFRFYILLQNNDRVFTKKYFNPSGSIFDVNDIAPTSIASIFYFSKWKVGTPDPLDKVDAKMMFAKGNLLFDQNGIEEYLDAHGGYLNEIAEIRKLL